MDIRKVGIDKINPAAYNPRFKLPLEIRTKDGTLKSAYGT